MIQHGKTTLVAGNNYSTTLAGVTLGESGRSAATFNILYMTTNWGMFVSLNCSLASPIYTNLKIGLAIPVNRTVIVGGKGAYIDTSVYP